jgi:hypothetical protein
VRGFFGLDDDARDRLGLRAAGHVGRASAPARRGPGHASAERASGRGEPRVDAGEQA